MPLLLELLLHPISALLGRLLRNVLDERAAPSKDHYKLWQGQESRERTWHLLLSLPLLPMETHFIDSNPEFATERLLSARLKRSTLDHLSHPQLSNRRSRRGCFLSEKS